MEVKKKMPLDEFAKLVESALDGSMRVRIDHEALRNPILSKIDELTLEPREAILADLLLHDLRQNRLDFRFDAQGITIIPRHVAWSYMDQVEYAAKEYQVDVLTLRDLIIDVAPPDDWADVGGMARIVVNDDAQTIRVTHAQSDHLRFGMVLGETARE